MIFKYIVLVLFPLLSIFSQTKETPGDLILIPQSGHTQTVWDLSTSANPNFFLSSSLHDGQAFLWTMDGKMIRPFSGLYGQIQFSSLSPDGKFLITASTSELALWDINGNIIKKIPSYWGNGIAFTKDSKYFILLGSDLTLQIYDIKGNLVNTISGEAKEITVIDFSPDGKTFISGGSDGKLRIWNLNGSQAKTIDAHSKGINFAKFSPDGKIILTGSYDKTIKRWDAFGNLEKEIFGSGIFGSGNGFPDMNFSPDGKTFITAVLFSYNAMILDLDGNEIQKIDNLYDPRCMTYTADGKNIVIGEGDGSISIFDSKGKFIRKTVKAANGIYSIDYDGKAILFNSKSGGKIWDTSGENLENYLGYDVSKVSFNNDRQKIILTQFNNPAIIIYNRNTKAQIQKFSVGKSSQDVLKSFSISNNDTILTNTYEAPEAKLWNLEGKLLQTIPAENEKQFDIAISPDGNQFALTRENALVLKSISGKTIASISGSFESVISLNFSQNGKYILVNPGGSNGYVYDLSGKLIFTISHNARVFRTISSKDEKLFLSGGEDKTVKLWNSSGKLLKTFTGFSTAVYGMAFSEDGKFAITTSVDGLIRYFRISDGNLVVSIMPTEFGIVSTTPDGRFDYGDSRAMQFISYRKGGTNELISLDQVFQSFYTTDLFRKAISGTLPKLNNDFANAVKKNLPELSLELPGEQNNGKIDLNISACDKGGGIQNIAIYQNGNLINQDNYKDIINQKGNCKKGTISLELANGQNDFKLAAFNSSGIKVESVVRSINYSSTESQKPEMNILIIGVNEYISESSRLKFAVSDAKLLSDNFNKYGRSAFRKINVYEIYDNQVTRDGIINKFNEVINKAKIDDTVIIFFSGHGLSIEGKFYYIPYNVADLGEINSREEYERKYPAWERTVKQNSFSSDEITMKITQIKSVNKMLIIDSCQSGGNWMSQMSEAKRIQKLDEQRMDMNKKSNTMGIAMISAAQQEDSAFESKKLGHGFLAHGLLQAMQDEKDRGKVTAFSTLVLAAKRVFEVAKQFNKKQIAFISIFGVDFDLSD